MKFSFTIVLAAMLSACATGYGKSGWDGGYWDRPGPGEIIEIGFNGNGYIKSEKVEIYVLFRSAEIALSRGKPYFSIYRGLTEAISDQPLTEQTHSSSIGGKPYSRVYMLMHDQAVTGALEAQAIIRKYDDQVKGNKPIAVTEAL